MKWKNIETGAGYYQITGMFNMPWGCRCPGGSHSRLQSSRSGSTGTTQYSWRDQLRHQQQDTPAALPPLLEFNDATVILGNNIALDSVSFRIEVGENVAIIGPNGSGKSTLIRTITRDYYPLARDGGPPVRIMGEHVWNIFELREMLGIVTGELERTYHREISGFEMVLSGFFGSVGIYPYQDVTPEMEASVRDMLDFLEIADLAGKYVSELSTGEARRVLIARALVHDPRALMLDEPANGLDPHAVRHFLQVLRKIAASGKSIIMVTHHLHDIIPEIDRVIMLKNGRIFRDACKEEVLTPENLTALFNMPVEVIRKDGHFHLWT